jgi:hypothetical protein
MPPKQPARTTDRRRGPKAKGFKTLTEADAAWKKAAAQPFTPLFNDRRGSR